MDSGLAGRGGSQLRRRISGIITLLVLASHFAFFDHLVRRMSLDLGYADGLRPSDVDHVSEDFPKVSVLHEGTCLLEGRWAVQARSSSSEDLDSAGGAPRFGHSPSQVLHDLHALEDDGGVVNPKVGDNRGRGRKNTGPQLASRG